MTARANASLLVIDGESSVLQFFRNSFQHPDFDLRTAATGAVGLQLAAADPPDVIVLDLRLPDLSGMAVFGRLRERGLRVPVIFITSQGNASTAIEAMKQGAYDYLLKPLQLPQVREAIRGAVR